MNFVNDLSMLFATILLLTIVRLDSIGIAQKNT